MYVSLSLSFFVWKFKHLHVAVLLFESGLCFGILLCDLIFNGCCRHILLWADATTVSQNFSDIKFKFELGCKKVGIV